MHVKNSLKFSWIYDDSFIYWTFFYKIGMNDFPRWQFWSMTQPPVLLAFYNAFNAGPPWPWPRDMINIYYDFLSSSLESFSKFWRGSAPTDKININGTLLDVSL